MITYRHIIFRITIVAFLAAFLTFIPGCGDEGNSPSAESRGDEEDSPSAESRGDEMKFETGNPEIDKVLDDMKFENAETLGPIARKYFVAMFNNDWEKVWDMMPGETHEANKKMWEFAKNSGSDEEKEMANKAGGAKEYYILRMKKNEKTQEEWAEEISKDKERLEVTGEEFEDDGKTGWIWGKHFKAGETMKSFRLKLKKEGDEWKIGE